MGGPEPPCQNKGILADIKEKTGRPCPRVELDPENGVAADVAKFLINERLHGLAAPHFEDWTRDWEPLERIEMRNRLASAMLSDDVARILRPPERPRL